MESHTRTHLTRLLAALATFVAAVALAADPAGTISGLVTDQSGASVVNAEVTVKNTLTGLTRSTKTDTDGGFLFPFMPVGTYDVSVEAQGFRRFEQRGIRLLVNGVANLPVALQLGTLSESVTVNADAAMVETRSGTIKNVVDQQRIIELPLNGRNAATLVILAPGTADLMAGNQRGRGDAIQTSTYPGSQAVSASGSRSDGVNYLLDGGDHRDPYTNINNPFPNPEALQEFVVQTNNYGAEYGRASGAVVSVVTKSGTNQLHGSAFEFLRNEKLNARNFFSPTADILKRHQFGASAGGPIVKDKLFYFATIQGTTLRALPASLNAVVPTAGQRRGDFSSISRQLRDPSTGTSFPGNQIPASRFDPASVKLLDYLPVPTDPAGVIFFKRPNVQHEVQFMGRGDYNTSRHRLYSRYFFADSSQQPTDIKTNLVAAAGGRQYRSQSLSASDTYTFNPNLINSAIFTFNRTHGTIITAAPFSPAGFGVPIAATTPSEISFTVSGYFSIGTDHPSAFNRQNYNFSDALHYIRGSHELAFGIDYLKIAVDVINTHWQNGTFRFQGTGYSGNAMSDFFAGTLQRFIQGGGEYLARRGSLSSAFVQDNLRFSRRFTLNLGVRYDPFTPYGDAMGFVECFRPGSRSTRFPNAPLNVIYSGDQGCPDGGSRSHWLQFAPRLGFSYDLTGKGQTVLRGGYGIFYQPPFLEGFVTMTETAPFSPRVTVYGVALSDPYRGIRNPFPQEYGPRQPQKDVTFELPMAAVSFADDWGPGQIQSWNLTLERQLRADVLLRVAYVGSKGTHVSYNTELNAAAFGPAATAANIDARRSYRDFGSVIEDQAAANSNYNSLQTTLEKRFSKGFSVLASYTWGKSIDPVSYYSDLDSITIINPFNVSAYRGLSDYDISHRFVLSYLWQLPRLKGSSALVRTVLGGWATSGIWNWQVGFPLSITSGEDRALSGIGNDLADLVGDPFLSPNRPRAALIDRYFNTGAFTAAALGTFGNAGRNILRGPGTFQVDFSASKNFQLTERFRLQYRAEFFNFFNTPLLNNPSSSVSDSRFGRITSARDPRIIQMALKLYF